MKILELKLPTANLTEQKSFYIDTLGFELLNESGNSFTLKTGNSKLTFNRDKNSAANYYHFAFNIPENQLNEAAKWLEGYVTLLEHEGSHVIDFPNWNAHSIYFYDSSGNVVELIARHNLNIFSDEVFSAKSIINISEAGMPVESVANFYSELNEKLSLSLWYGNLETFAAIGDEEGLFIVVTKNRNWFPTDKPCNIYPLAVKLESSQSRMALPDNPDYKIITVKQNIYPEELIPVKNFLDDELKIKIYPASENQKKIIIKYLAGKFKHEQIYTEKEVNQIIKSWHTFNDHSFLRRELVDWSLLARTSDGKQYRKK